MRNITDVSIIIPDKLAAFIFDNDEINILRKLLEQWHDSEYLFEFYNNNEKIIEESELFAYGYSFLDFMEEISYDVAQLESFIAKISKDENVILDTHFRVLSLAEEQIKILSLRKKRCKWLRIYAIRIDENFFVITGGAIKITKKMQDHIDTRNELAQLNYSRDWLKHKGVDTGENFYQYFEL